MVNRRKLHRQAIRVREVNTVRPARPVWIEALPLQVFHDRIGVEVLDRDAEMVQPRSLVLEEREEVFPQAQEAVRFRFMDYGRTKPA